jgi:hypothetical protein
VRLRFRVYRLTAQRKTRVKGPRWLGLTAGVGARGVRHIQFFACVKFTRSFCAGGGCGHRSTAVATGLPRWPQVYRGGHRSTAVAKVCRGGQGLPRWPGLPRYPQVYRGGHRSTAVATGLPRWPQVYRGGNRSTAQVYRGGHRSTAVATGLPVVYRGRSSAGVRQFSGPAQKWVTELTHRQS